jgi:hypothetical protein
MGSVLRKYTYFTTLCKRIEGLLKATMIGEQVECTLSLWHSMS